VASQGEVLARPEGDLRAEAKEALRVGELLGLFGSTGQSAGLSREDAIAVYLAASDGWREAVKRLGGTFADTAEGLKAHEGD
jgi:hypothetical protein